MANDFIRGILESARGELSSEDRVSRLEEKLAELEDKCVEFFKGQDRDYSLKLFRVHLVIEAIQIENTQLCLLALKKLPNLHNLIQLLDLGSASPSEIRKLVSNYFQIDEPLSASDDPSYAKPEHSTLVEVRPDPLRDQQHQQQPVLGTNALNKAPAQELPKPLAQLEDARDNETEENFAEAMSLYESSGAHHANFLRVSMKHLMCASHDVLQKYCVDRLELRPIWFNYLIECKSYQDAVDFCESIADKPSGLLLKFTKQHKGDKLFELLPNGIREFATANATKWTNLRQLDSVVSIRSKDKDIRSVLAELSTHYLKHDDLNLALSMAFSLNRTNLVLDQYLARSANHQINLSSVSWFGPLHFNNSLLLQHLMNGICYNMTPNHAIIRSACTELGLIDELMQLIPASCNSNEFSLNQILERLEGIIDSASPEKLDTVDPLLKRSTMTLVFQFLKGEGERNLIVQLISMIIFAINIFLLKLDPNEQSPNTEQSVMKLEVMFECLCEYLEELTFSASDGLVRATNNLVIAIKSKLDALADSEIIRDSFMKIVDKIAGLCLIDARYKSAAILYSQIEDNVNAVKALMRTGEPETVMNYALLVRDITVNRITINYIKHLRLEPEIIENFIRRSKL